MNYDELSREVSYALRHAPWEYELEMDGEGWVPAAQLMDGLKNQQKWPDVSIADLKEMIRLSDKKRHEMEGDRIRAFYGHSIPMKIQKCIQSPPLVLYHGTAGRYTSSINENGLLPRARQYVHLSEDIATAMDVGKRRDKQPVILEINALDAYKDGIKFYYGNEKVWLADYIPSKYIRKSSI